MYLRIAASAALVAVSAFVIPAQAADTILQATPDIPAPANSLARAPQPLQDAVQAAWRQYPGSREADAELAAARARLHAAGQPIYNPEVELAAEDEGPDRSATAGLSLRLDLSGKRRARSNAATARLDQALIDARLDRRNFVQQWFSAWAAWRTAEQRVQTGERRVSLVSRFAELALKQFKVGDISGLDRDLAQLALSEGQAELSALVAERAEAEARFRAVGGSPELVAGLKLPTDALPPPEPGFGVPSERLLKLRAAEAAALAARREVTVAKRNRIPDPEVGVHGGRIDYGNISDQVVGVSLSIPLFIRNSYGAEVAAARAEANAAAARVDRIRIKLASDRRRAIDSYAATRSAWTQWQASRGTDVRHRADLLERLWRQGELSTTDYLLQLQQTLNTALAGAELEARLWRSYTDYLATTGQLERWAGLEATP